MRWNEVFGCSYQLIYNKSRSIINMIVACIGVRNSSNALLRLPNSAWFSHHRSLLDLGWGLSGSYLSSPRHRLHHCRGRRHPPLHHRLCPVAHSPRREGRHPGCPGCHHGLCLYHCHRRPQHRQHLYHSVSRACAYDWDCIIVCYTHALLSDRH